MVSYMAVSRAVERAWDIWRILLIAVGYEMAEIASSSEFDQILTDSRSVLIVVHFCAPWAPQCVQMNDVMDELKKEHLHVKFFKVEAEQVPEVSHKYEISAVPTFLLFKNKKVVDRLNGANAPELTKKVSHHGSVITPPETKQEEEKQDLDLRLKSLTNASSCMLFMKGSPQEPKCGFSRQTVGLLNSLGAKYGHFDILTDPDVRQGLKTYSNWPSFPQLYVNGELIGGLDIMKEMAESGELASLLPKQEDLNKKLGDIISSSPVMLFMKGNAETPQCGFSREACRILKKYDSIKFGSFDILEDQDVRQGLKTYSNWPTFPQLYVKSELIGGLDIMKELDENGELEAALTQS